MSLVELGEFVDFRYVLETEPFIITDTDTQQDRGFNWYSDYVYPARHFRDIDGILLERVRDNIERLAQWYSQPNVHAPSKVVQELERFSSILQHKLAQTNKWEESFSRWQHGRLSEDYLNVMYDRKRSLEDIFFLYGKICKSARKKMFRPEDAEFYSMMDAAVQRAAALHESKHVSEKSVRCSSCADLHADEEIVAAAFYRSFKDKQDTCIVSPDSDIGRIIMHSCNFIDKTLLNGDPVMARSLQKHPVRYYFVTATDEGMMLQLKIDTSKSIVPVHRLYEKVA